MTQDSALTALVEKIHIVEHEADLQTLMAAMVENAAIKTIRVAFINAHAVNLCYRDACFLQDLLACDYVLRDGSGMKLLYRLIDRKAGLNLNGTDLIPRILKFYQGKAVALMGTSQPWLDKAAQKIREIGVDTPLTLDGFQPAPAYVTALTTNAVPLVVLAMGMPKQERTASLIAASGKPCLVLCGGAILDFLGEKVTRAPAVFRKIGMEWFYRLALEPKRLFRRYLIGNFVFLYRAQRFARLVVKAGPRKSAAG